MSECARCGLPVEYMAHFIVFDDEVYCENCFKQISQFREEVIE